MSHIGTRIAVIAAGAAGLSAALLALSPTASAEPVPAPSPTLPGLDMLQKIAGPGGINQVLQTAAAIFAPAPPAQAPLAPPPTAAITLPQPAAAAGAVPTGQLNVPPAPGLPVALPNQLSFPGDLTALIPGGLVPGAATAPGIAAPGIAAPGPAAPGQLGIPALNPVAGLP